jgi:hypothetical protein
MATTISIVPNSRTPESVVLLLQNNGVVDAVPLVLLKADLMTGLLQGPLRELINRTPDLSVLHCTETGGRLVRMTEIAGGLNSVLISPSTSVECRFVATGLSYAIFDVNGNSGIMIELRLLHSNER